MKLGDVLNNERVGALCGDKNAYISNSNLKDRKSNVDTQSAEKVLFPEAYENVNQYYNKNNFCKPSPPEPPSPPPKQNHTCHHNNMSGFDIKSLLSMLMGGNFNDVLKPLMSILGGGKSGGGMDIAKIFEMFKPKSKPKKE